MASFTRKAIMESCMKLLEEKPVNKISVKDIVEDCGINRNTFYYHFEDLPDLVNSIILEETDRIISEYKTVDSLMDCMQIVLDFVLKNRRAAMHLFNSANREIYERSLMNITHHVIEAYVDIQIGGRPISPLDRKIIINSLRNECFGAVIDWMSGGMKTEPTKEFLRLCELKRGMTEEMIQRCLNG